MALSPELVGKKFDMIIEEIGPTLPHSGFEKHARFTLARVKAHDLLVGDKERGITHPIVKAVLMATLKPEMASHFREEVCSIYEKEAPGN